MTTEVTPRYIRCKECGKVWSDKDAYTNDPGCERTYCLNAPEGDAVSRRRGRRGLSKEVPWIADPIRELSRIQVHRTTGPVLSIWDPKKPIIKLTVPDVININIFPRYK